MVSRVARKPINIPSGVDIKVVDEKLTVKGKLGELSHCIPQGIKAVQERANLRFEAETLPISRRLNVVLGTTHAMVKNMVKGVADGFQRGLLLIGVGYRAETKGEMLNLTVGFSHPVEIKIPEGLTVKITKPTEMTISGIDRQRVSQFAATIRDIRPPEPYKGKGIRYQDEQIKKKEVKKK
jgi:large subunit ribosomal protein L6